MDFMVLTGTWVSLHLSFKQIALYTARPVLHPNSKLNYKNFGERKGEENRKHFSAKHGLQPQTPNHVQFLFLHLLWVKYREQDRWLKACSLVDVVESHAHHITGTERQLLLKYGTSIKQKVSVSNTNRV